MKNYTIWKFQEKSSSKEAKPYDFQKNLKKNGGVRRGWNILTQNEKLYLLEIFSKNQALEGDKAYLLIMKKSG